MEKQKEKILTTIFFKKINILIFLFLFPGIAFLIIGVYGVFIRYDPSITSILPLGLGFSSVGLGLTSIKMSYESDKKIKLIIDRDFLELVNEFWNIAPYLYEDKRKEVRDTLSWYLVNFFRRADRQKEAAGSDVQSQLIKELKTFLERLRPTRCKKFWVEIKNYMGACNLAIGFNTDKKIKDELIDELGNWIGKKEEKESNEDYLKRKSNELRQKKNYEVYKNK